MSKLQFLLNHQLIILLYCQQGPPVGISNNNASALSKRKKSERSKRNNLRSSMGELLVIPFLSKFSVPCDANVFNSEIPKA